MFELEMMPWVEDERNIIKAEVMTAMKSTYFIHARTINGAVFLSENFDWEDAVKRYKEYKSLTSYFGGGIVTLYEITFDDCEVIIQDIVY